MPLNVPMLEDVDGPPRWFDALVRSAAFGVVALGLVGLPLALLGEFCRLPVLVGSALVFAGLHALWGRGPRVPVGRSAQVCATLAVLVAVVSGAVNSAQSSQHLVVDGDPAVYLVTGELLADTGGLDVPTRVDELYAGEDSVSSTGSGYFDRRDEAAVYPQFFHLLPVLLAVGSWLGGLTLMLSVNPILGSLSLLAVYAFAARVVRAPFALIATTALAVLLPQLHFSRDAFSEIASQLLVFAGLALLWDVTSRRASWRAGLITGLVLGASAMARIDAFVYVVPIALGLLLLRAGRTGAAVLAGFVISAAVALLDGAYGSPAYLESVRGPLLQTALALLLVGGAFLLRRAAWIPRLGGRLAAPVAGLVVGLAALAWFVRPYVQTARKIPERTNATIASLQAAEGVPVDVPRSYDEETMLWLSWYLGPVALALGVLGLAWVTYRVLRGRDLHLAPFVLLVVLVTAVYLWHPGIFPVQYWASRRFLPVSFPGLLVLAVLLCSLAWSRLSGAWRALPVLGLVGVLGFPLALLPGATLPRSYAGLQDGVEQVCGSLLPDDVVLLVGEDVSPPSREEDPDETFTGAEQPRKSNLPQAVTAYCGVTAASASDETTPDDISRMAEAAAELGRRFVLLSPVDSPPGVPSSAEFRSVVDVTVPTPALSLTERPDEVFPYRFQLFQAVL